MTTGARTRYHVPFSRTTDVLPSSPEPSDHDTMPECANCEAHVSTHFHRVFNVDGAVHACPQCITTPTHNRRSYHPDAQLATDLVPALDALATNDPDESDGEA